MKRFIPALRVRTMELPLPTETETPILHVGLMLQVATPTTRLVALITFFVPVKIVPEEAHCSKWEWGSRQPIGGRTRGGWNPGSGCL